VSIDVHQHLWPPALVEALRRRQSPPRLVGWRLELSGEPAYDVRPADHDVDSRRVLAHQDGLDLVLLSLSSPLGIEQLPPAQGLPLLAAWHDGVAELTAPFGAWASAAVAEPDPAALTAELDRGCLGLQLPATALADPSGVERLGPLLAALEEADRPLLVHPGPAVTGPSVPAWWAALVPYVSQQHAAWYAWHVAGRRSHPGLRVCFVALAGLAPLHHERLVARGGRFGQVDPLVWFDVSSYGTRGIDAMLRVVGVDVLVHGSDRPYAGPSDSGLGEAVRFAVRTRNPSRFLTGSTVTAPLQRRSVLGKERVP